MANDVTVISETTQEKYRVRLLVPGDRYGLDGKLRADRALVEFYDPRYVSPTQGPLGQLIARYELGALLERDPAKGLDLAADRVHWKIDAKALNQALTGLLAGRRDLP